MHVRSAGRLLRAAWVMLRDERTLGTVFAVILIGVVALAYYAGGESPESSRDGGPTSR